MTVEFEYNLKFKDGKGTLKFSVSYGDQHAKESNEIKSNLNEFIGFQLNRLKSTYNYIMCDFIPPKKEPHLISYIAFETIIEYSGDNFEGLKEVSDAISGLLLQSAIENEYLTVH